MLFRPMTIRVLLAALVLSLVGGGLVLAQGTPSTGQIVFSSDRDGDFELYLLDLATGEETQLTDNTAFDGLPAWSPDGAQIVFASDQDGNYELYRIDADGSNLTRLTETDAGELYPSFSPDGTQILFETDRDGQNEIYLMDAEGAKPQNLTRNDANDNRPVWSPDGERILFLSNREGETRDLWVLTLADGSLQRLTEDEARDVPLAWLADGTTLLYRSNGHGDGSDNDIYAMQSDGSDPRNLTRSPYAENGASQSPDGAWIVYRASVDGNADLYVMDLAGENIQPLTEADSAEVDPAWRPQPATAESAESEAAAPGLTCEISAPGGVNLRSGPGTTYAVAGGLSAGAVVLADGQAADAAGYTWYRLADEQGWVREDVVNAPADCAAVPAVMP